ncbi:MAG: hypothetical protein KGI54_14925 [Pseudomonadota bacterium]|nr:hypothetical protein [Pseudomonadota bacterium]
MALPNITVPQYPSVPPLPGVPALLRAAGTVDTIVSHIAAEASTFFSHPDVGIWGIFDQSGNPALTVDTFAGIEFKDNMKVSDYPIEAGSFTTFNKVETPYLAFVTVALGGTSEDRTNLLLQLRTLKQSTQLFTIVTPETSYINATIERYDYRREQRNGAHFIVANIYFIEVRQTAIANFGTQSSGSSMNSTATKSASAQADYGQGTVQTVAPPITNNITVTQLQ